MTKHPLVTKPPASSAWLALRIIGAAALLLILIGLIYWLLPALIAEEPLQAALFLAVATLIAMPLSLAAERWFPQVSQLLAELRLFCGCPVASQTRSILLSIAIAVFYLLSAGALAALLPRNLPITVLMVYATAFITVLRYFASRPQAAVKEVNDTIADGQTPKIKGVIMPLLLLTAVALLLLPLITLARHGFNFDALSIRRQRDLLINGLIAVALLVAALIYWLRSHPRR